MKRRFLCLLLAAVMLVGLIPVTARADDGIDISDEAIEVLKKFEGFSPYAYYDYGQYSIGYGTSCGQYEYPNGITEEQGEELLRNRLKYTAAALNEFAAKWSLTFNQGQFDALMLFSFNVGEGWMKDPEARFRQAIIDQKTGNDLVYFMTLWSIAGTSPHRGLIGRRLCEADMYLNGNYSNVAPANYNYILLNAQEGKVEDRMQGYITTEGGVQIRPVPEEREGYRFMGWYSETSGGQWITTLDESHDGMTFYAHWQKGEGTLDGSGNVAGTPVSYQCIAGNCASLNKYAKPNEAAAVTGTLQSGDRVSVVADYVDDCNVKWGKLEDGSWVMLGSPVPDRPVTQEPTFQVTVTNTYINVRRNPGASSEFVGTVHQGQVLTIVRTREVDGEMWGKFSGGWICLKYTDYDPTTGTGTNDAPAIAKGVVVCNDYLNVRKGPGTNYDWVGTLLPGDEVEITEFAMNGTVQWARIRQGWVSMDYIKLYDAPVDPDEPGEGGETPDEPEDPEDPDEPADPEDPEEPKNPGEKPLYTGTVTGTDTLRIRSAAGVANPQVGTLYRGDKVAILEETKVNDALWGRIDKGWIALMYISRDPSAEDLANAIQGVVISFNNLNVRSAPGAFNALKGSLAAGTVINIYEQTMLNGVPWGRTDLGWVCMTYVQLIEEDPDLPDTPDVPTPPPAEKEPVLFTGTVINTNALRVRSGAGTHYAQVGTLGYGNKVEILEMTLVNNMKWGRTEKGWISLDYIQMVATPGVQTIPLSGKVSVGNTPLKIRAGAGVQHKLLGELKNGTKISIYEIVMVGNIAWGRMDQGWVCMDYVKLEIPAVTVKPSEPEKPEDPEDPTEDPDDPTEDPEDPTEETEKPTEKPETDTVLYTGKIILTNALRVRSGAGTNHPQVGTLTLGTKVNIYAVTAVNGMKWGRIDKGWIALNYVQVDATKENALYTLEGTVSVGTTPLKVRSGAGVQYPIVEQLVNGTKITVYDITFVGTVAWGRVDKGWVCLDYVTLSIPDPDKIPDNPGTLPEEPGEDPDTPEDPDEPSDPEEPSEPEIPEEPEYTTVIYTGKTILTNALQIRKEANANSASVGTLPLGTKVEIYNVKIVNGAKWGRVEKGWIALNYVELDKTRENAMSTMVATVTAGNATLKIRSGPAVSYNMLGQLTNGTKVTVYDITFTNGIAWGRINQGWICLDYVKLEVPDPSKIPTLPGGETVKPADPPAPDVQPEEPKPGTPGKDEDLTDPETPKEEIEHLVILVTEETIGSIVAEYPNLKSVNFKNSGCYEAIAAFAAANPGITVTYQVDLGGTSAENTVTSLYLEEGKYDVDALMANLKYLPAVTSVYLRATTLLPEEIAAVADAYSDVQITWSVQIGENLVQSTATSATLVPGGLDIALLCEKMAYLPNLTSLHLRRTTLDMEELNAFKGTFPAVNVTYSVEMFGSELSGNATSISLAHLKSDQVELAAARLAMFPQLKELVLIDGSGNSNLKVADVKKLMDLAPDYDYQYKFNFYGHTLDIHDTKVVVENIYIGDNGVENLRNVLSIMKDCTYMSLGDPGIDYKTMADIRDEFRGRTKVAWLIYYGAYKGGAPRSAMSDTEVLHHVYYLTDKNCDNLKYFEDVKYIDFGHNETLTRIDYIQYMPKLEMIILSGSSIRNLDAFANHQNIQFIEVAWCTNITDISGVQNCPNLKYLNISHTKAKDISVVHNLPLELFMCIGGVVNYEEAQAVKAAIPDCWITYTGAAGQEYGIGWRYNRDKTRTEPYDKLWDIFNYGAYWN